MSDTTTATPSSATADTGGTTAGFPAGIMARLVGRSIDLVLVAPFYLVSAIARYDSVVGATTAALAVGFVLYNQVWRVSRSGASIGKSVMGTRIIDNRSSGHIALWRAALREIVFVALTIVSAITLLRKDRRAVHDLIAGTFASDGIAGDALRAVTVVDASTLEGAPGRRQRETDIKMLLTGAALASLIITALIVFSLVAEAWTFISNVELSALWGDQWAPRFGEYDIKTLIVGSLIVTAVAMVVALPVGLGSAVYLSEYANP
ncbi:MAG: RDD family protein, partial [Acidimicrobiia bacterium]|nr:RDD family protein [Acidimicrobiia bacterium]